MERQEAVGSTAHLSPLVAMVMTGNDTVAVLVATATGYEGSPISLSISVPLSVPLSVSLCLCLSLCLSLSLSLSLYLSLCPSLSLWLRGVGCCNVVNNFF